MAGDFNVDFEQPRGARQAAVAGLYAEWVAGRGLTRLGHAGSTRRVAGEGSALDWIFMDADAATMVELALTWVPGVRDGTASDHAIITPRQATQGGRHPPCTPAATRGSLAESPTGACESHWVTRFLAGSSQKM